MAHHYASTSFGHHHGPLVGAQSGWNLEDSLRTENNELLRKEQRVRQERDYAVGQIEPLKEELSRLAELLDQEIHSHADTREELRVVEERHVAAYKLLQERMDSEVSWRDVTIKERDAEIVRLGRLIDDHMARLEELEKAKYDEIEALNEQITRERESHRVAMDSAERETASLQRQLEYSQQDAIIEQDRWRARLTEAEAERHRQVEELKKQMAKAQQQHRRECERLQRTLEDERRKAAKTIAELEAQLAHTEELLEAVREQLREAEQRHQEEVAGLKQELLSERQAREEVEAKNVILTKQLADALAEIEDWKKKCGYLEDLVVEWEICVPRLHSDMQAGLQEAADLSCSQHINSDLPAVYQVHALEPLVQVKVSEAYHQMLELYTKLQHSVKRHFPAKLIPTGAK